MATDLTTKAKVKKHIRTSATTWDDLIDQLVPEVSESIRQHCNVLDFASVAYTEQYDGRGQDTITLRNRPVSSVTSVHDDPDRTFGSDTLLDADDDYAVDLKAGIIRLDGGVFDRSVQGIKVVYTAGHAGVPGPVELAANILVAQAVNLARSEGRASEGLGNLNVTHSHEWPPKVVALLAPYVVNGWSD